MYDPKNSYKTAIAVSHTKGTAGFFQSKVLFLLKSNKNGRIPAKRVIYRTLKYKTYGFIKSLDFGQIGGQVTKCSTITPFVMSSPFSSTPISTRLFLFSDLS